MPSTSHKARGGLRHVVMPAVDESFFLEERLCHKNNLAQKTKNSQAYKDPKVQELMTKAEDAYLGFLEALDYNAIAKLDLGASVLALDDYISTAKDIEKAHGIFGHRSNYAGSIIPEFLYRVVHVAASGTRITPFFSTRNTIIEITGSSVTKGLQMNRKDEDFAMGLHEVDVTVGDKTHRVLSLAVACEVKTNIDINKLNGLDFSAERMKRSFPGSVFFLATETFDCSLQSNYASSYIDEIYVLRRQLRSRARRGNRIPLSVEVFTVLVDDILQAAHKASNARGHVYSRLPEGRLIHV